MNKIKQIYGELKYCEVHLQADLDQLPLLPDVLPFHYRILDKNNAKEIESWIELINEAYTESSLKIKEAKKLLNNHHFFENTETYLVFDNEYVIASVSIGLYRADLKVGGVYRLAVSKSYQNKGLGKFIILLGYHLLRLKGVKYGESVINSFREKSIVVHLKCGLKPQTNPDRITHKNSNFNKNFIQRYRAKKAIKKAERIFNSMK